MIKIANNKNSKKTYFLLIICIILLSVFVWWRLSSEKSDMPDFIAQVINSEVGQGASGRSDITELYIKTYKNLVFNAEIENISTKYGFEK